MSQGAVTITARNGFDDFTRVREILLTWLRAKVGHQLPPAMARGETDTLDQLDALRTETVSLADPVFWSFRRDDQNPDAPQRTWITEASLALDAGRCGFV